MIKDFLDEGENHKISSEWEVQFNVLLALLIPSTNVLKLYSTYLKGSYWTDTILRDMVQTTLKLYDHNKVIPTFPILKHNILELCNKPTKLKMKEEYIRILDMIVDGILNYKDDNSSRYYTALISDFVAKRHYTQQALNMLDKIDRGEELFSIEQHLTSMNDVPKNFDSIGYNVLEPKSIRLESDSVSTMIPGLDKYLKGNGLSKKKLGVVVAPANVGKSFLLNRLGIAAVFQGKTVIHYSIEMDEEEVVDRYLHAFSKLPEIIDPKTHGLYPEIEKKLSWIKTAFGGLVVKEFATATPKDIEAHLNQCIVMGKIPDLVIIDSINYMKPSETLFQMQGWESLGLVYKELTSLKKRLKIPIWGADHTLANSHRKKQITLGDLGKFAGQTADVVISLCQTMAEEQQNRLRLFITKNRGGPKHKTVFIETDFARGIMREADEPWDDIGATNDEVIPF